MNVQRLALLAALAGGAVAFYFRPSASVLTAPIYHLAYLTGMRGKRLTHSTTDDNGDVVESPVELAIAASQVVGRDVTAAAYALARNIHSEEGGSDQATQTAVAWVAVNVANGSIVSLLTRCRRASGQGKFGSQTGRWASTARDPYEGDLEVAEGVLSGAIPDPTGGAVHYFRPTLQDLLFNQGKVKRTADEVASNWGGNGYTVDGVDSGLTFFQSA